jgi:hypothetical protein
MRTKRQGLCASKDTEARSLVSRVVCRVYFESVRPGEKFVFSFLEDLGDSRLKKARIMANDGGLFCVCVMCLRHCNLSVENWVQRKRAASLYVPEEIELISVLLRHLKRCTITISFQWKEEEAQPKRERNKKNRSRKRRNKKRERKKEKKKQKAEK